MEASLLLLAAVPLTGFVAGFINTLAGSGSLITLPLLILLGLPANVANGTNRVGVLVQNIVAVAAYRRRGALETAGTANVIVPTVIGSVVGAQLAVDLDEALLRRVIGLLMLALVALMLLRPRRWIEEHARAQPHKAWLQFAIFFAIGVYGGFIQAGVAIFLVAGLVLGAGHNLLSANVVKNLIVLVFTAAALVVFVINDQVHWGLGLLLALGQAAGAWVAVHVALARGAVFIRWLLVAIVTMSALALLADIGL